MDTQLKMVEELALLIKDNLPCKHLVLSMEECLIEFLQNSTSPNGVLELEPMSSYHRMLLHRLADIFGFAHESTGEGVDRHLVLERSPESTIPAVLVSDILLQYDHHDSSMASHQLLKRKEVLPDSKIRQTASFSPSMSLEERELAYLAARERIFSSDKGDGCEMKEAFTPKPRNVPVVARRMIAHALGRRIYSTSQDAECQKQNNVFGSAERNTGASNGFESASIIDVNTESMQGTGPLCDQSVSLNEGETVTTSATGSESSTSDVLNDGRRSVVKENSGQEHLGAAKRLFAQALSFSAPKEVSNLPFRCSASKNLKSDRSRG